MTSQPLWSDPAELPVRRLADTDREGCMALAVDREWRREEPKWEFLFETGEVYGIDAPDGGLAGCYVLTRYAEEHGPGVAAIGMVLVAARFNGRGLGRRLMTHALSIAGDAAVVLHATELGRPLYEKLGFERVDMNSSHYGVFTGGRPDGAPATRPAESEDLDAVIAYDRTAFGCDRAEQLRTYHRSAEHFRVAERDGRIAGFAGAWRNEYLVLGPVVAEDLDTATALLADIAATEEGTVRIDVLHSRSGLREWAIGHGIAPKFDGTYMVHEGRRLPGDPARLFAPINQAV